MGFDGNDQKLLSEGVKMVWYSKWNSKWYSKCTVLENIKRTIRTCI